MKAIPTAILFLAAASVFAQKVATPLPATEVMAEAKKVAAAQNKAIFLKFDASW